jgi:predicted amino acid-binding ACT domain protein
MYLHNKNEAQLSVNIMSLIKHVMCDKTSMKILIKLSKKVKTPQRLTKNITPSLAYMYIYVGMIPNTLLISEEFHRQL